MHIGLILSSPRASRETQNTKLREAGAERIVEIGILPKTWREALSAVRNGDTVYVYALSFLPTKRGQDELMPSAQVADFLMEVHERGGTVVEVVTGRNSRDRKQRRGMIGDAVKELKRGTRRPPSTGKAAGRPKTEWPSEDVRQQAIAIWKSPDFATRLAATKNMPKGVNSTLVRTLGKWPGAKKSKKR